MGVPEAVDRIVTGGVVAIIRLPPQPNAHSRGLAPTRAERLGPTDPPWGAQVQEVSLQDLMKILEFRRCLEPYAARIAIRRVTPPVEKKLRKLRKAFEVDDLQECLLSRLRQGSSDGNSASIGCSQETRRLPCVHNA
jgi:hypothetical protein